MGSVFIDMVFGFLMKQVLLELKTDDRGNLTLDVFFFWIKNKKQSFRMIGVFFREMQLNKLDN